MGTQIEQLDKKNSVKDKKGSSKYDFQLHMSKHPRLCIQFNSLFQINFEGHFTSFIQTKILDLFGVKTNNLDKLITVLFISG